MDRSDKLKKVVDSFIHLNFDEKVEFIKAMTNSIKLKEVNCYSFDEKKKIEAIKKMLEYISSKLKSKNSKPQITSILPEISELTDEQLTKLVVTIVDTVHKYTGENEQLAKEEQCRAEGHIFSDWKERKYTRWISPAEAYGIEGLMNGGTNTTIPIDVTEWHRTCERCGFMEKTEVKPREVAEKEEKQKKARRIRALKKELKELKKN